jgi:hypothetical protein
MRSKRAAGSRQNTRAALTAPAEAPAPIIGVTEQEYDALTTLAAIGLILLNGLTAAGSVSVAPPVAPNLAPPGDVSGRVETDGRKSGRKTG